MSTFRRKYKVNGQERVSEIYSVDFRDQAGRVHRLPAFRDKAASGELERRDSGPVKSPLH